MQPPRASEQRHHEQKLQRSVSHEVERAIPLISASAPHATTLARQPCRNLAHMRTIWLKIPSISSFFRDNYPHFPLKPTSFSLAITRVFHLSTGSYPLILD